MENSIFNENEYFYCWDNPIEKRVITEAQFMIDNNSTIRQVADNFMVSKSTVFLDLRKRLPHINIELYDQVDCILRKHKIKK